MFILSEGKMPTALRCQLCLRQFLPAMGGSSSTPEPAEDCFASNIAMPLRSALQPAPCFDAGT